MHSILNWSGKTESIVFDGLLTTQEGKGCGFNPRIIETRFSLALKKKIFFVKEKKNYLAHPLYLHHQPLLFFFPHHPTATDPMT